MLLGLFLRGDGGPLKKVDKVRIEDVETLHVRTKKDLSERLATHANKLGTKAAEKQGSNSRIVHARTASGMSVHRDPQEAHERLIRCAPVAAVG